MEEEEIEEWYSQELEKAMADYVLAQEKKKGDKLVEDSYIAKIRGIRAQYGRLYSQRVVDVKKGEKSAKRIEKYESYVKRLKGFFRKAWFFIRLPWIRLEQLRKNPKWVIAKARIRSRHDVRKLRAGIKFDNFLISMHLKYPLFWVSRSYRKYRIAVSEELDEWAAAVKGALVSLKDSFLGFFGSVFRSLGRFFGKIISVVRKVFMFFFTAVKTAVVFISGQARVFFSKVLGRDKPADGSKAGNGAGETKDKPSSAAPAKTDGKDSSEAPARQNETPAAKAPEAAGRGAEPKPSVKKELTSAAQASAKK